MSELLQVTDCLSCILQGKKRNSKPLHVKDVKKAKVRSSVRLRTLKNKMIDGPGKDASSPLVVEDGDEVDGIDDGTRE